MQNFSSGAGRTSLARRTARSLAEMSILGRVAAAYGRASQSRPVIVQSCTSGCIASIGDVLMQQIEQRGSATPKRWDRERTGRIALFRLTVFGPGYTLWMRSLERLVTVQGTARAVVAKTLLDQLVWTPPSLSIFYVSMAKLEGLRLADGFERAKRMLWPTLQVNWPFWCCVHLFTFTIVPPAWRMAWVSTIHVGWNAFISGLNEKARLTDESVPAGGEEEER